jgi:hypothetical protein
MFFTGGRSGADTFGITDTNDENQVERGQYLVEEVAKCPECHTPRNERGELKRDARLRGARTWIRPVAPIENWADRAPFLAGLPSFTDETSGTCFGAGTGPNGESERGPEITSNRPKVLIYVYVTCDTRSAGQFAARLCRRLPVGAKRAYSTPKSVVIAVEGVPCECGTEGIPPPPG